MKELTVLARYDDGIGCMWWLSMLFSDSFARQYGEFFTHSKRVYCFHWNDQSIIDVHFVFSSTKSVNVWTAVLNSICLWLNWFEHKIHLTRALTRFIRWITCGERYLCVFTTSIFTKFKWKRATFLLCHFFAHTHTNTHLHSAKKSTRFFSTCYQKVVVCLFSFFW